MKVLEKKYVLIITLNPSIDKILSLARFEAGKEMRVTRKKIYAGGKGINVARSLHLLGNKCLILGILAGSQGAYIHQAIQEEGLEGDFLYIPGNTRTNLTIISQRNPKLTRILEEGPKVKKRHMIDFTEKYLILLKNASHVVFTGRTLSGCSKKIYYDFIKIAKTLNVKTILDSHGEPLSWGMKACPNMVTPNLEEAENYLHKKLNTFTKIVQGVKFIKNQCGGTVLLTLGPKGALLARDQNLWLATPPKIKAVNPVGCGDVFLAGFLGGLLKKETESQALCFGVAVASLSALSQKPGSFHKTQVKRMLGEIRLSQIE